MRSSKQAPENMVERIQCGVLFLDRLYPRYKLRTMGYVNRTSTGGKKEKN